MQRKEARKTTEVAKAEPLEKMFFHLFLKKSDTP